jgi:hypothetical protein
MMRFCPCVRLYESVISKVLGCLCYCGVVAWYAELAAIDMWKWSTGGMKLMWSRDDAGPNAFPATRATADFVGCRYG